MILPSTSGSLLHSCFNNAKITTWLYSSKHRTKSTHNATVHQHYFCLNLIIHLLNLTHPLLTSHNIFNIIYIYQANNKINFSLIELDCFHHNHTNQTISMGKASPCKPFRSNRKMEMGAKLSCFSQESCALFFFLLYLPLSAIYPCRTILPRHSAQSTLLTRHCRSLQREPLDELLLLHHSFPPTREPAHPRQLFMQLQ